VGKVIEFFPALAAHLCVYEKRIVQLGSGVMLKIIETPIGLLEDGVDIQALLGHAKLDNTAFYTKVATRTVRTVTNPLDKLGIFMPDQMVPGG
jgi:hypothetical protein